MVLVIAIFAYYIADIFLDVFKTMIDTIFLCFAEDSKHNNGKDKPYYMSDALLKFMNSNASNEAPAPAAEAKKSPSFII